MKRRTRILGVGLALLLAAAGATACSDSTTGNNRPREYWYIGTGNTGGTYYPLGGHLAKLLSDDQGAFAHVTASAQVTGATIENIRLLQSGEIKVGFGESSGVWQAMKGQGVFDKPVTNLRAIGVLFFSWLQVVTKADSGIRSFSDLKGKRVSVGEPGSSTALLTADVAEALGMSINEFGQTLQLGFADQTSAFRDNQIDVGSYLGALNMAALKELDSFTDLYVIGFPGEDGRKVQELLPYMVMKPIPAGTYEGQNEDWGPVPVSVNTILVRDDMSDEDAYQLTKLIFENSESFVKIHAAAADMTLENISANTFVPLHPGAIRYYEENGIQLEDHHRPAP